MAYYIYTPCTNAIIWTHYGPQLAYQELMSGFAAHKLLAY